MPKKINVLIVDDSEIIIRYLTLMLKGLKNIQPLEAATLSEAKKIIINQDIDIIVLDIELPDGNGIAFIKWIKNINPRILIVMFSTLADSQFRTAAKKEGTEYFFDKSYEFKGILEFFKQYSLAAQLL
jgi:DNA-binding NarL/FixJ family response regulator